MLKMKITKIFINSNFYQIMQHLQELQNEAKVRNPHFFTKKGEIIEISLKLLKFKEFLTF